MTRKQQGALMEAHEKNCDFFIFLGAEILKLWRLLENVQMLGARDLEESPLKSGIYETRTYTYVAVTKDERNDTDGGFPTAS